MPEVPLVRCELQICWITYYNKPHALTKIKQHLESGNLHNFN